MIRRIGISVAITALVALPLVSVSVAAEAQQEILISAAISLQNAFEEIGKVYESQNPGVKTVFNFGASGDLVAQIKGGAPVDVFASAAVKDMDDLDKDGYVLAGSKVNFAGNTLVLIVPAGSKAGVSSFDDLAKASVKKIAACNPKTVPAGRYADEVFQYVKIAGAIRERLVYAENVRQVLDYVARGEADAGVVYATDAMTRQKEVTVAATAPTGSHRPVVYPIAVVKGTKHEKAATDLIRFVASDEGKTILEKYGFRPVKK